MPESFYSDYVSTNVHNDGLELLGEIGVFGASILLLVFAMYFKKLIKNINEKKQFSRFILLSLLLLTLFIQSLVDYSLHVPGILILLISILSIGLINFKRDNL